MDALAPPPPCVEFDYPKIGFEWRSGMWVPTRDMVQKYKSKEAYWNAIKEDPQQLGDLIRLLCFVSKMDLEIHERVCPFTDPHGHPAPTRYNFKPDSERHPNMENLIPPQLGGLPWALVRCGTAIHIVPGYGGLQACDNSSHSAASKFEATILFTAPWEIHDFEEVNAKSEYYANKLGNTQMLIQCIKMMRDRFQHTCDPAIRNIIPSADDWQYNK
jgi:hypothetical protein